MGLSKLPCATLFWILGYCIIKRNVMQPCEKLAEGLGGNSLGMNMLCGAT